MTSAGLLTAVPSEFRRERAEASVKPLGVVLLTGATGFVGAHILEEIIRTSSSKIICLVRAESPEAAQRRLDEVYARYFPDLTLPSDSGRCVVYAADLAKPHLGLSEREWNICNEEVDVIFNAAADTRLFASKVELDGININAIRILMEMTSNKKLKELHHISTLAVSGSVNSENSVLFSEHDLYVGQVFISEYERSKFQAEQALREFIASGGKAFIYRVGNVGAHSSTGHFQLDPTQNRFIQLVCAISRLRQTPRSVPGVFEVCPVDDFARACVAIARSSVAAPGTFHIKSEVKFFIDDILATLKEKGVEFGPVVSDTLENLLQRQVATDVAAAVGLFWIRRPERNITYISSNTDLILKRIGYEFNRVNASWLGNFCNFLLDCGVFDPA